MVFMKDFELLPHTADLKIRAYGTTREELFCHALIGMFQAIGPQSASCKRQKDRVVCESLPIKREISINSSDLPALLVDFLSEALYLSDANNEAYLDCKINSMNDHHIDAVIYGVAITGFDSVEIKAVTYNELVVKQLDGEWYADIVFDI